MGAKPGISIRNAKMAFAGLDGQFRKQSPRIRAASQDYNLGREEITVITDRPVFPNGLDPHARKHLDIP
jgi:hypothetical protein